MKRSGGFSTGQAINGHGDESDPLAMASSATVVSFHPSFLLMSLLFFQAALNELITSAFMNKVGVQRRAALRITSSFKEIRAVQPALCYGNPGDRSPAKKNIELKS